MTALALVGLLAAGGCARISEVSKLRVVPLEKPRRSVVEVGKGYLLRGKRVGDEVVVQVARATYCAGKLEQRARGYRVVKRTSPDHTLTMEWLTGIIFSGVGGWLFATAGGGEAQFVDGEARVDNSTSQRLYGGGIGLIGGALLTGAIVQTLSLGRTEIDLGERTLKRQGAPRPCKLGKARSGRLRLTLDDGLQLEADVGADGMVRIKLPADIAARIRKAGPRATLEALGDWRSQRRLSVAAPPGAIAPPAPATPTSAP